MKTFDEASKLNALDFNAFQSKDKLENEENLNNYKKPFFRVAAYFNNKIGLLKEEKEEKNLEEKFKNSLSVTFNENQFSQCVGKLKDSIFLQKMEKIETGQIKAKDSKNQFNDHEKCNESKHSEVIDLSRNNENYFIANIMKENLANEVSMKSSEINSTFAGKDKNAQVSNNQIENLYEPFRHLICKENQRKKKEISRTVDDINTNNVMTKNLINIKMKNSNRISGLTILNQVEQLSKDVTSKSSFGKTNVDSNFSNKESSIKNYEKKIHLMNKQDNFSEKPINSTFTFSPTNTNFTFSFSKTADNNNFPNPSPYALFKRKNEEYSNRNKLAQAIIKPIDISNITKNDIKNSSINEYNSINFQSITTKEVLKNNVRDRKSVV